MPSPAERGERGRRTEADVVQIYGIRFWIMIALSKLPDPNTLEGYKRFLTAVLVSGLMKRTVLGCLSWIETGNRNGLQYSLRAPM